jgi:hypothetical protein
MYFEPHEKLRSKRFEIIDACFVYQTGEGTIHISYLNYYFHKHDSDSTRKRIEHISWSIYQPRGSGTSSKKK